MAPVTVHPADPQHPKGMAWVLGVGMVDPRKGNYPRQVMAITQSWEPTSELWWDLGLRWHPDLATKWAVGGGQFAVAEIVTAQPEKQSQTLEQAAEETLEYIASEHPEYAEMLRQIRESGSDEERAQLAKQCEGEIKKLMTLMQYITKE